MELRTLNYFLAIAQERNISKAAQLLHAAQPTLSRAVASLEQELGCQLYVRKRNGIELTEKGKLLAQHAENILDLVNIAESDFIDSDKLVSGIVKIGSGDTRAMELIGAAIRDVRSAYPNVVFEFYSGNTADLRTRLDRGLLDMLLECDISANRTSGMIMLPVVDTWCAVMRRDDPLARKSAITSTDLSERELIVSRQGPSRPSAETANENDTSFDFRGGMKEWAGEAISKRQIVALYTLPLNLRFLVAAGVGIALTYENLIVDDNDPVLCTRPLFPQVRSYNGIVQKKGGCTRQASVFLDALRKVSSETSRGSTSSLAI